MQLAFEVLMIVHYAFEYFAFRGAYQKTISLIYWYQAYSILDLISIQWWNDKHVKWLTFSVSYIDSIGNTRWINAIGKFYR